MRYFVAYNSTMTKQTFLDRLSRRLFIIAQLLQEIARKVREKTNG